MPIQHTGPFNSGYFINAVALFVVFNTIYFTIDYRPFNLSPVKPVHKTITSKPVVMPREVSTSINGSLEQDRPSIADMHELNACGKIIFIIKQ